MYIDGIAILLRSMIRWLVPKNPFTVKCLVVIQGMMHIRIIWACEGLQVTDRTKVLLKGMWWIISMSIQCKISCRKGCIQIWSRDVCQHELSFLFSLHEVWRLAPVPPALFVHLRVPFRFIAAQQKSTTWPKPLQIKTKLMLQHWYSGTHGRDISYHVPFPPSSHQGYQESYSAKSSFALVWRFSFFQQQHECFIS